MVGILSQIKPAPTKQEVWDNFWAKATAKASNAWEDMMGGLMAPGNALRGNYDQLQVMGDGSLSQVDPRMVQDASSLAGMLTLGAGALPAEAGALRMGAGNFEKWFGKSKIATQDGSPQTVYHGSKRSFDEFSAAHQGSATDPGYLGEGFYLSDNPRVASIYAGDAGSVYPLHVAAQNPLILQFEKVGNREKDRALLIREKLDLPASATPKQVTEKAKERGYDGVVYVDPFGGKEIVAFDPRQIKSAIGNRGTFDPNDPNILNSRGGAPLPPQGQEDSSKRKPRTKVGA